MPRWADKLQSSFKAAEVLKRNGIRHVEIFARFLSGSITSNRKRGRRAENKPPGKQRTGNSERGHNQLYDLLSVSSDKKLPKELETALEQTGSFFIDTSKIPFLKYMMPAKELDRFKRGKCTKEEKQRVLGTIETILPRRKSQIPMIARSHRRINARSLRGSLFPGKEVTPEDSLERIKEKVCAFYSIEESEYEKYKTKALKSIKSDESTVMSHLEWNNCYQKMMEDPFLVSLALSIKQNPSLSDNERVDIAKTLMEYSN